MKDLLKKLLRLNFYWQRLRWSIGKSVITGGSVVLILMFIYITVTLVPFFAQIKFSASYQNFWPDAQAFFLKKPGAKTLEEMKKAYGKEFQEIRDPSMGAIVPSKQLGEMAIIRGEGGDIIFFLVFYPMLCFVLGFLFKGMVPEKSRRITIVVWLVSAGVVAGVSYLQAWLDYGPQFSQHGVGFHALAWYTFGLSYTTGVLFVVVRQVVDANYYYQLEIDPQTIYKDDLIVLGITVPLLWVFGNGPLDLLLAALAGMAPFVLLKMGNRAYPDWFAEMAEKQEVASGPGWYQKILWRVSTFGTGTAEELEELWVETGDDWVEVEDAIAFYVGWTAVFIAVGAFFVAKVF